MPRIKNYEKKRVLRCICNKEFFPKSSRTRYCSEECKKLFKLKRKIENDIIYKKRGDYHCKTCNSLMKNVLPSKKFCKKECTNTYRNQFFGFDKFYPPMDAQFRGIMSELLAAADLIRKGFQVFKAVTNNSCDLVIMKNSLLHRVEVTSGNIFKNDGKIHYPKKDKTKFDVLAIVMPSGKIIYQPEFFENE